jgi:hypothetical protein
MIPANINIDKYYNETLKVLKIYEDDYDNNDNSLSMFNMYKNIWIGPVYEDYEQTENNINDVRTVQ